MIISCQGALTFPRPTLDLCTSQKVKSRLQGTDHACSPYAVKASYQVPNRHSTTTTSHPSGHCQPNPKGGRVPGPSSQRGMGGAAEMTGRCSNLLISSYKHPHPQRNTKENCTHLDFSWFQAMRIGFLYKSTWHSSIFPFFPRKTARGQSRRDGRDQAFSLGSQSEWLCPSSAPGNLATREVGLHSVQQEGVMLSFQKAHWRGCPGLLLRGGSWPQRARMPAPAPGTWASGDLSSAPILPAGVTLAPGRVAST